MRVVTLEEHITFPELVDKLPQEAKDKDYIGQSPAMQRMANKLADIDGERLQSMDENGITVQVLSVAGAGADLLDAAHGPTFARQYNDAIAERIAAHPDRFRAFAHLPTTNPEAAADELERTVKNYRFCGALINGLTNDEFLDDEKYAPIFARAEELDVPIYLHPGLPPKAVFDAYYSNLPKQAGPFLSIAGWGWHSETALHTLRLIVSGTLDKYPHLKLIIGHMGEMLPMMMVRTDKMFGIDQGGNNQRSIIQTLRDQVHITTSGLFSLPPLQTAIDTFGIDNIMFSIDYPFSTNQQGKQYLESMQLPTEDLEKLAHGNADKLLKLK
ncbi:amidohydrolase family protein [Mucilaginibacter sp.]|uniref:amidohydrolase family protein n=1 Tax=Mucilaginibacter sp. TaxID=1882438 RepID=UPI00285201B0|nr:amidohydrolase family protein [Mucilaginibacter sp.]MDR3695489.1 amidohydrolase family protein [Mucilaginibacter sp.]